MIELIGQPGDLRMVLEITRAATGETETVELVGTLALPEDDEDAE